VKAVCTTRASNPFWEVWPGARGAGEQPTLAAACPTTVATPAAALLFITEVTFYFPALLRAAAAERRVFERFPRLKFIMTEAGVLVGPRRCSASSTRVLEQIRKTGRTGGDAVLRGSTSCPGRPATTFRQSCYVGREPAQLVRRRGPGSDLGLDKFPVGERLPPRRGHPAPFNPASTCASGFSDASEDELRTILGGAAAEVYGFDLDRAGAAGREGGGPRSPTLAAPLTEAAPSTPTRPCCAP